MDANDSRALDYPENEPRNLRLTFQQRFYWQLFFPDEGIYRHEYLAYMLEGEIDAEIVRRTNAILTERHDSLRSKISIYEGTPYHSFLNKGSIIEVVDASCASGEDEKAASGVRNEIGRRARELLSFDENYLFGISLFRLSKGKHVLVIRIHHLIFDGGSLAMLLHEFWSVLAALKGCGTYFNEISSMQHLAYTKWQETEHLSQRKEWRSYWSQVLAGATAINWPLEKAIENRPNDVIVIRTNVFDRSISAVLRESAKRNGPLLSLHALAAFIAVAWKWCRQEDVVVATNVECRDRPEHATVAGYLVQPLYLRIQMHGQESIAQLLKEVSKRYFSALKYRDFGEAVLHNIHLCGGTLFQWFPNRTTNAAPLVPGLQISRFEYHEPDYLPKRLSIAVAFGEAGAHLFVRMVWRRSMVTDQLAGSLLEDFYSAFQRVVMDPNEPVSIACGVHDGRENTTSR